MNAQLHVAGVLARIRCGDPDAALRRITAMPGAEVHATSADGKVVVTLEAPDAATLSRRLQRIQRIRGVLSAMLVYQYAECLEGSHDGSS